MNFMTFKRADHLAARGAVGDWIDPEAEYRQRNPDDVDPEMVAAKICIDLGDIQSIYQNGYWSNNEHERGIAATRAGMAPRRGTRQRDNREVYVIEPGIFFIQMKGSGQSWKVLGNFDEFSEILTNFQNDRETV